MVERLQVQEETSGLTQDIRACEQNRLKRAVLGSNSLQLSTVNSSACAFLAAVRGAINCIRLLLRSRPHGH